MLANMVAAKAKSSIGQFRSSTRYKNHLLEVAKATSEHFVLTSGPLETDPQYKLIVASNKIIHDIDDEILGTFRYIADIYAKKFPELENLVTNKLDYIRTVQRIGNEMDMTLVELGDILPSSSVMIVSVTGSTTSGLPLSDQDLSDCFRACDEVLALDEDKSTILKFVESRMSHIAPNLSHMIGTRVAAQLIGIAGGLVALSKIPSCNIELLGQEKKILAGLSGASAMPHIGILYFCELVQRLPSYLRRKALKNVAAKVALVARVDSYNSTGGVADGARFRADLESKFEKWLEPDKARTKKALPIPEETKRSKRGGRRVRKMKERMAVTEVRSQQNKVSFSMDAEYGDSAMGVDTGMFGSRESGKLRAPQRKDNKIGLSKRQKTSMTAMSSGTTNGLSSSLAFTPVQGLELINPNAAAERLKAANQKWFNANSGFLSAAPPK